MREEESTNWFSKWEEQLPPPDDLIPLTQSLITPHLAIAFNIPNPNATNNSNNNNCSIPPTPPPLHPPSSQHNSGEYDSTELGCCRGEAAGDEPPRTLKRPRLVWTPQLHKRFVDAVAHLGIKNAVPKTIMQLMSVDGLTRENVASHLQKYRLYLKRMQGLSTGGVGGLSPADAATDHLFASSPVPAHFLHPGRNPTEHSLPFVPVATLQHHHHHHLAAAAAVAGHQQYNKHFGSSPNGQQYEHPFLARQPQHQHQVVRMGTPVPNSVASSYVEDLGSGNAAAAANGRRVLTLFPTGGD